MTKYTLLSIDTKTLGHIAALAEMLNGDTKSMRKGGFQKLKKIVQVLHPEMPWSRLAYVSRAIGPNGDSVIQFTFLDALNETQQEATPSAG